MYGIVRSDEDIDNLLNECVEAEDSGSKYPGISYEEGIRAAIDWLIGDDDVHPLED